MKKLYMVGHSHIDLVWFWDWKEGMQEVKATFQSALQRMDAFPEFRFSTTSAAAFQWMARVAPAELEAIKKRVDEGRWELCGGWLVEPDCIIPSGEAFVRQGLYGQRWFHRHFGRICRVGANPDGFGHEGGLPQILLKSGMDRYVFMRPRVSPPAFEWAGPDGSRVTALSLPGEYTTWFHEPTKKNIEVTLERGGGFDEMVCCYGVGNHGGGPTIANIESILRLRGEYPEMELAFAGFGDFFDAIAESPLEAKAGPFEKVNLGCYSNDHIYKQLNRQTEQRLAEADTLMVIARETTGRWPAETARMEALWGGLLFNQFHDTLGGTVTRDARNQAAAQMAGSLAGADAIVALAMQDIANAVDTTGEGWPLFVYNAAGRPWAGMVEVELEWFCQDALRLVGPHGGEVGYQRVPTDAKVTHTTLGGRRRILFYGQAPAGGFSVYRLQKRPPAALHDSRRCPPGLPANSLENDHVRLDFDPATGMPCGLADKAGGYQALRSAARFQLWRDEREAWGGLHGQPFGDTGERLTLEALEKVEDGPLRQTVRGRYRAEGAEVLALYHLGARDDFVTVELRLQWNRPWQMLKLLLPAGGAGQVRCDAAYSVVERNIAATDKDDYYMHRWADVTGRGGGLCVANDSLYAFSMEDGGIALTLVRSPIYAQGNSPDWQNPAESYHYIDLGEHHFSLVLHPHAGPLPSHKAENLARQLNAPPRTLHDSAHGGPLKTAAASRISVDAPGIELCLAKKAEEGGATVLRLREAGGAATEAVLTLGEKQARLRFGPWELKTLRWAQDAPAPVECDLLEWAPGEGGRA